MALDKLVDSAQLDSDLASVANAIRTKGGTSASLSFPQGFVDAVGAIQTGGDPFAALDALVNRTVVNFVSNANTLVSARLLQGSTILESVSMPNCTTISGGFAFSGCSNLQSAYFPKLKQIQTMSVFENCKNLQTIVLPSFERFTNNLNFSGCTLLRAVDLGYAGSVVDQYSSLMSQKEFQNCTVFDTLVLRYTNVRTMGNLNNFAGTPFESGGAGGTIYIPRALYDHLGDGTSLDYKSATNWSTLDGYGTITWATIEGSIYETQYADGTPIA